MVLASPIDGRVNRLSFYCTITFFTLSYSLLVFIVSHVVLVLGNVEPCAFVYSLQRNAFEWRCIDEFANPVRQEQTIHPLTFLFLLIFDANRIEYVVKDSLLLLLLLLFGLVFLEGTGEESAITFISPFSTWINKILHHNFLFARWWRIRRNGYLPIAIVEPTPITLKTDESNVQYPAAVQKCNVQVNRLTDWR